jgi:hypothetical protein
MSQRTRIFVALGVLLLIVAVVLGVDWFRRREASAPPAAGEPTVVPGGVPIHLDGRLVGSFSPDDLDQLEQVSFVEPEEGKEQTGWLLRDVILRVVDEAELQPQTRITVSSSSREKSAQVTWAQADDPDNWVMFDLSNRGTLKLVSLLESLDTRDEWVQDTDRIEIESP